MAAEVQTASKDAPLQPTTLQEELRRNPEMKESDIAHLRDWAEKQPHLPKVHDREFALFLHSCSYNAEAAKALLDTYFTTRTHLPEFFALRDPLRADVQLAAGVAGFVTLPEATNDGSKVIMVRPTDTDPSNFNHADITKIFTMVVDLWLLAEGTAPGHIIVFDMDGVSFGHFTRFNLMVFKKIFFYLQEAVPFRLRGLHFINVVPFMDKMMTMMKPFIKKTMYQVMHVHTRGLESLYKFVPQNILPEDYGGSAPPFFKLHERTLPWLVASRDFFLEEERRVVQEQRRQGRARCADDLFGAGDAASFKQLDID